MNCQRKYEQHYVINCQFIKNQTDYNNKHPMINSIIDIEIEISHYRRTFASYQLIAIEVFKKEDFGKNESG